MVDSPQAYQRTSTPQAGGCAVVRRSRVNACCLVVIVSALWIALVSMPVPRLASNHQKISVLTRSNTVIDVSETIAMGVVTDTLAFWCDRPFICTRITLRALATFKGAHADVVEFTYPGGAIGDTSTVASHAPPRPTVGDTLVVLTSKCRADGVLATLKVDGEWARLRGESMLLRDFLDEVGSRVKAVSPEELAARADLVVSGTFTSVQVSYRAGDWGAASAGDLVVDSVLVRREGKVQVGDIIRVYVPSPNVHGEWAPEGGSTPGFVHPSSFPAVLFLRRVDDDAWRVLPTAHSMWRQTSPDSMAVFVWPHRCSEGPYATVRMDRPSLIRAIGG